MITPVAQGARVAAARARIGLSVREFAATTGVSPRALLSVEAGTKRARMDKVVAISRASGVPMAELTEVTPFSERVTITCRGRNDESSARAVKARLVALLRVDASLAAAGVPLAL